MRNLPIIFCLVLGAGWRAQAADAQAAPFPLLGGSVASASEPVDDRRIMRKLEKAIAELAAAGRTVKVATLVEQLKNRKCAVDLAAPGEDAVPAERFYERLRPSVLIMAGTFKCTKCTKLHTSTASGYVISRAGVCVTNHHVVNSPNWETVVAMTADGRVLPVKAVLAASSADDVAILQLDGEDLVPVPFAPDAPVGSRVRVIAHPDERFYVLTEGIISRYFRPRPQSGEAAMMAITADFAKGSSGAPVFNDRGAVVGMVASTQSVYYDSKGGHGENLQMVVKQCVPASGVLKLIERVAGGAGR